MALTGPPVGASLAMSSTKWPWWSGVSRALAPTCMPPAASSAAAARRSIPACEETVCAPVPSGSTVMTSATRPDVSAADGSMRIR